MRKLLLLLLSLLVLSCSKEKEPDYITLDKNELTMSYMEEKSVLVETNVDYFTANTEDDYVADAIANKSTVDVSAWKVGETKIIVNAGTATAELLIKVEPKEDYIGTPVVALGKDAAYIKANENSKYLGDAGGSGDLFYQDTEVPFGAHHAYRFENGKLLYIITTVEIPSFSSKFDTYLIQISNSLQERYKVAGSVSGNYRLVYFYQYKNGEYYIGVVKGNGWHICYAKTKEEVMKRLDKHPSIAI